MTISIKATRGNSGSGDPTSISGPTVIIKGATNTYTITDYDSFSVYEVTSSVGTVSRTNETITLMVATGEVANTLQLTVNRDGNVVVKDIAIGAQVIGTPNITSPASGSTDVNIPVTLLATAFTPYPTGADTHASSDWRVKNAAGTVVWQSLGDTVNKTSITVPTASLSPATQYFADVRYNGNTLGSSSYSSANQFTTSAVSIVRPSITSPVNGATGVGETPTFTSSTFATIPAGSDTHSSSSWRVKNVSTGATVWSSLNNTVNKTNITMPSGLLAVSTQYTVEVQYNGVSLPSSNWSLAISFTTALTFAFNKYLALANAGDPNITLYGQDVDTFTKLSNPTTLPTGTSVNSSVFSQDGIYLAFAHNTTPFITIYKRSGDTFTKLANPSVLPTGAVNDVSFSPDGIYLACGGGGATTLTIYKRSGDTFTKLANPSVLPNRQANSVAFSPDGLTLAVASISSPYLLLYNRSGDTFSKSANPAFIPTDNSTCLCYSSDGTYLAVGSNVVPLIYIYKISSGVYTRITFTGIQSSSTIYSVAFSTNGDYLAAGVQSGGTLVIYKRSGDTFTQITSPSNLPGSACLGVAFSADSNYLAAGFNGSPTVAIYKRSGDTFTKLANPSVLPAGIVYGVSFYPPVIGS